MQSILEYIKKTHKSNYGSGISLYYNRFNEPIGVHINDDHKLDFVLLAKAPNKHFSWDIANLTFKEGHQYDGFPEDAVLPDGFQMEYIDDHIVEINDLIKQCKDGQPISKNSEYWSCQSLSPSSKIQSAYAYRFNGSKKWLTPDKSMLCNVRLVLDFK